SRELVKFTPVWFAGSSVKPVLPWADILSGRTRTPGAFSGAAPAVTARPTNIETRSFRARFGLRQSPAAFLRRRKVRAARALKRPSVERARAAVNLSARMQSSADFARQFAIGNQSP